MNKLKTLRILFALVSCMLIIQTITFSFIMIKVNDGLSKIELKTNNLKRNVDSLKMELENRDEAIKLKDSQISNLKSFTISYYAQPFHGRRTASGSIYNMYDMTVAHKTLPFGTKIHIINPKNGKSAIAIVTDRGPFIKNREFDVSYGIAKKIDMLQDGVIKAKISLIT